MQLNTREVKRDKKKMNGHIYSTMKRALNCGQLMCIEPLHP